MELLRIFCLLLASGFSLCATGTTGQPECQPWKNVTDIVKRLDPLNVTCDIYQPCTGFKCNGIMNLDTVKDNVSFGISILPCSDPLKFQVDIDIAKYPPFNLTLNVSKNQVINNTFPLPGLTRNLGPLPIEGNLSIILSSTISPSGEQIVTAVVAVTVKVIGLPPPVYHFVLIPNVTFPVPQCPSQTQPPSLHPLSESLDSATENTTPEFTGSTCSPSSLRNPCGGKSQMCGDGKCFCLHGYSWNGNTKECEQSSSNGPATWIIVVAAVCTVIAIAGFMIFLVYKYRRNQGQYGRHTLLINNDNDAEFDDPDPPMLTG